MSYVQPGFDDTYDDGLEEQSVADTRRTPVTRMSRTARIAAKAFCSRVTPSEGNRTGDSVSSLDYRHALGIYPGLLRLHSNWCDWHLTLLDSDPKENLRIPGNNGCG